MVQDKEKEKEKSRFSLPFIGITSPFFAQSARVPSSGSISGSSINSTDETDHDDRPLTPPPALGGCTAKKPESPHRIPSFEFEEISLQAVEQPVFSTARVASPVKVSASKVANTGASTTSTRSTSTEATTVPQAGRDQSTSATQLTEASTLSPSKPNLSTSPLASRSPVASTLRGDFEPKATTPAKEISSTSDSTTTRIRQRISREMVRETINQRLADGSISRRGSTQALVSVSAHYADLAPRPPRPTSIALPIRAQSTDPSAIFANRDKVLPPPPSQRGVPMIKAHTTDANPRRASGVTFDLPPEGSRPSFRPRSQTQSAHEVLKANERDGVINEPKSALDKIIGDEPLAASSNGSTSSASTAILKPVLPVPPPKTVQFPMKPRVSETLELASTSTTSGTTDKGTARAESVTVKSHNKDGRVASNVSVGSTNSRRSRRSMSMGDAPDPDVVGIDLIFA